MTPLPHTIKDPQAILPRSGAILLVILRAPIHILIAQSASSMSHLSTSMLAKIHRKSCMYNHQHKMQWSPRFTDISPKAREHLLRNPPALPMSSPQRNPILRLVYQSLYMTLSTGHVHSLRSQSTATRTTIKARCLSAFC